MSNLKDFYTDKAIIKLLCKHRAKIAYKRHKKHMLRDISIHDKTNKIKISPNNSDFLLIQSLFPTRRNWKKLNRNERLNPEKLNNSLERNQMRLWKSYKYEKYQVNFQGKQPDIWYFNLLEFCDNIRSKIDGILKNEYFIDKPIIFPIPKSNKNGIHIYRPIAKYNLEDKIITSIFGKYLTLKFDKIFLDCSYAFRPRKNGKVPNHHDSIIEVLKYRKKHKRIWVSECDIQKFFDCVQHDHLLKVFEESVDLLKSKEINISQNAIKLFSLFLKSYSFNTDVLIKNKNPDFFKAYGLPEGEFGWVKKELNNSYSNSYIDLHRIGVPQGNAISCFIANLILNKVDRAVKEVDPNLLYVRYCDDMLIAHKDENICKKALEVYKKGIRDNYLLYHKPKKIINYKNNAKDYWKEKSKEPFFLGNKLVHENNVPWLSFVGYQINYKGIIRVRKVSIQKEIKKQINETQQILISLGLGKNGDLSEIEKFSRKTKDQINFSLQQRLISMSVGRVTIFNYDKPEIQNGMCWTNGFHLLRKNRIVIKQLKQLDRSREEQLQYLKRAISHLNKRADHIDDLPKYMKDIYFGLPYSYYNQIQD